MNKCSSVLDFLCQPIKAFLNKCLRKTNHKVQKNDSNKVVVEEIDTQTNTDSIEELKQISEIIINTSIPDSKYNKPKDIPNLKFKNLIRKDSLSDFVNNNYLKSDFSTKQNYGSDVTTEVRVNND